MSALTPAAASTLPTSTAATPAASASSVADPPTLTAQLNSDVAPSELQSIELQWNFSWSVTGGPGPGDSRCVAVDLGAQSNAIKLAFPWARSVALVSASLDVSAIPNAGGTIIVGWSDTVPATTDDALRGFCRAVLPLAPQFNGRVQSALPGGHPFGVELALPRVGGPRPVVYTYTSHEPTGSRQLVGYALLTLAVRVSAPRSAYLTTSLALA